MSLQNDNSRWLVNTNLPCPIDAVKKKKKYKRSSLIISFSVVVKVRKEVCLEPKANIALSSKQSVYSLC